MNSMSIVEFFVCVASKPNLDSDIQEKLDSIVVTDPLVCDNPKLLGGSDSAPSLPSEEQFDSDHDLANTTTLGIPMTSLNSRKCNETAGGSQRFTNVMEDFASCLFNTEFDNLNATGIFYSWSNKRDDSECILRKLDRVLVNERDDFIPTIFNVWSTIVQGSKQFQVCKKLKLIKQQLKRLNKDHVGNVYDVVVKSKADLDMCQRLLNSNPFDNSLRAQEKIIYDAYVSSLIVEEMFLRQKSRVQWLKARDKNSSFFFKSILKNRSKNHLVSITRVDRSIVNSE
ncbi:hypothetical protein ACFX15_013536 [Malus domestica]